MKLRPGINLIKFLDAVRLCKGDILLSTDEGDRLNLKSTLSQYIFVSMETKHEFFETSDIACEKEEDLDLLKPYLLMPDK